MHEETGSVGSGNVAMGDKVLDKPFVGNDVSLRKAIHAFVDLN